MRRSAWLLVTVMLGCEATPTTQTPDAARTDVHVSLDAAAPEDGASVDDVPLVDLDAFSRDPAQWDVQHAGPYRAGYHTWEVTYTPTGAAPRTIRLHVWYPTRVTVGDGAVYRAIFRDPATFVDAPLAPPIRADGKYPVHVYSHGRMGFGPTSYFLMRYFATHGWVSIAPDHTGDTLGGSDTLPASIYWQRSADISTALDTLEHLDAGDPLRGLCDTSRVLLSGHSFGTHTVWSSAGATFDPAGVAARCTALGSCTDADRAAFTRGLRDPRVVAAIPLAGAISRDWFGADGHRTVTIPMLSMSGSADPVGADTQFATTAPVDLTWIDVRDACHQFFALGTCSTIDNQLQTPIVGVYALAFARRHVLQDASAAVRDILEGRTVISDRVTLRRR